MNTLQRPILIAGTGALACLFAARLSAAGELVTMLGSWPAGLEALRTHGVRLLDEGGQERAYPVDVRQRFEDCAFVREALVLVKAWQTEVAARGLVNCLALDGIALSLQNGWGNREALAAALGEKRVAVGVTTAGATLIAPGVVRPAGTGQIRLAEQPGVERLAAALKRAGFQVHFERQVNSLIWGKLAINAAINPLTALLDVPNGTLLKLPAARELAAALAYEAAAVASSLGIDLPYPDPAGAAEQVARQTAENISSMLQDVRRGAVTEIDAICGAIVEAGAAHGIPTPVNEIFWKLVRARVQNEQVKINKEVR